MKHWQAIRYLPVILIAFFYHPSLKGQYRDTTWIGIRNISDSQNLNAAEKLARLHDCISKRKAGSRINDSIHSILLRQIGFVYSDQSDYIKAIQYFRESIKIIRSNIRKPDINPRHLIGSYYRLSVFYDSLDNVTEKMKAVDSCIAVSQSLGASSEISCVRSLESRAEYYFNVGDYHRCVKDAEMCEQFAWNYAANNKEHATLGEQYALTSVGWLVEALVKLKEFDKAEEYLGRKIDAYRNSGLNNYLGFVFTQLAQIEIHKGHTGKALLLFKQSLDIERQGGYDFTCKQILNTIGHDIYFSGYHDAGKALRYYNQALRYTNREKQKTKEDAVENMDILTHIGNAYVQQGSYDLAFRYFQQAFDIIKPGTNEKDVLQMPVDQIAVFKKSHILTGLVMDKADAFLERYKHGKDRNDAREAVNIYKVADKLLIMMRATQTDLKSKLFWRSNSRRLYERAIEACYLSGDFDEAFYFFEKGRSVLLNEQLTLRNLLSNEDIANQVQLSKKMNLLERELNYTEANSKKRLDIQNELFADQQKMDLLVQRVKAKNPLYFQTVLDTSVSTLADVHRAILKDHQALLEIFSGDSAVYALLIVPGRTTLHKIDKDLFDTTVNQYIDFFTHQNLFNSNLDGYKAIACKLYRLIFQDEQVPDGRIIISPDGRNFPFESLMVQNSSSPPVYFLIDHAVSYTYSARYLLNNFTSTATPAKGDFMGIAPVNFSKGLASLPGSDQSLKLIAGYFNDPANLIYAEASKSKFTRQFANYSIVQVYTHAAARGDTKEPVIYFSDSTLYLSDLIPENKPATKLIVLSACETGDGQLYLGEGVFNFNRGFAAYGIPSSITNLWSVESHATYKLTELLYKYLSRNLPVDIALQLAKKEFIATSSGQYQFPYFWAAAILMGNTDVISFEQQDSTAHQRYLQLFFIISGVLYVWLVVAMGYEGTRVKV